LFLKNTSYYLKEALKIVSTGRNAKWCRAPYPWVGLLFHVPLFMLIYLKQ